MSGKEAQKKEQKNESWHRNCLALFPTDVLNLMTGYLNGFAILALYNCGSGLLNYKLRKSGAVTHFRVRCGLDVFPPYRDWRNSNMRAVTIYQSLVSLEFTGFDQYAFRYFTTAIIADLPKTIQLLRFDFIEALTMWVDFSRSPEQRSNFPQFDVFELDAHFPQLRTLELRSRYWDRLSIYRGRQVTAFDWTPELRALFIAHIPKTVQYLTFSPNDCTEEWGRRLPDELHSLELCNLGSRFRGSSLPENLRRLTVMGFHDVAEDELANLPPQLEFLRIKAITLNDLPPGATEHQWSPNLPETLQTLHFEGSCDYLLDEGVRMLPTTLTRIKFASCSRRLTDSCIQYFPRSLLHLELCSGLLRLNDISHVALMDLPSGLLTLNLGSAKVFPWSCLEMLPPHLSYFAHPTFTFEEIPDQPHASPDQAATYWRSKTPPSLFLQFSTWNYADNPAEHDAATAIRPLQHHGHFWGGPVAVPAANPAPNDDDPEGTDTDTDVSGDYPTTSSDEAPVGFDVP